MIFSQKCIINPKQAGGGGGRLAPPPLVFFADFIKKFRGFSKFSNI